MYKYDKQFFNKIDNEEKSYWAGFIAADGNIRKDFLKMRIELNIKDYSHLEKFKKSINGNNPIKESIRPNNHSCFISCFISIILYCLFSFIIFINKFF